jgi:hypothetical protein
MGAELSQLFSQITRVFGSRLQVNRIIVAWAHTNDTEWRLSHQAEFIHEFLLI